MTEIRPLERDDLPQVVSLYELVMRSGTRNAPTHLVPYFERTLIDHPWTDAEIPSLVYEDDAGKIVGFLGGHVRRLRFDGRPIRLACSGHLVTDPEARHQAAGIFLLRRFLAGPQDVTLTDGATETVRVIWERQGGEAAGLRCVGWTRVFRPFRVAAELMRRRRPGRGLAALVRPVAGALDAAASRIRRGRLDTEAPTLHARELTPRALLDHLEEMTAGARVYPEYDEPFLEWLFRELAAVTARGRVVRLLVEDERGRALGWYVYFLPRRGIAQAVQVVARKGSEGAVLDHLFHHARTNGAVAVQGRVDPWLLEPLAERRCLLHRTEWSLIHSRDAELLSALTSRHALLTRLEGEWWMGHHLL